MLRDEFNLNVGNLSRTLDSVLGGLQGTASDSGDGGGASPDRMSTLSTFTGTGESYQNFDTQAIQASASASTRYKLWHVPEDEVSFVCAQMIG